MKTINNFNDFLENLYKTGMSIGGENGEGIFTLCDFFGEEIRWHTEEPDTDPWEWRMRVLNECRDIAYGKFFFNKSGYITKEWYPYFYRVRRNYTDFYEEYEEGHISYSARIIYDLLSEHKELPLHLLKQYGEFAKEDKTRFDNAVTELQMKFYTAMCGRSRKLSQKGEEYGWSSTVFCLTEDFFEPSVIEHAARLSRKEAYEKLREQVLVLNPEVKKLKADKFIAGVKSAPFMF